MEDKGSVFASSEAFPMTDIWMDSFGVEDHLYGLAHGAVGVTTSPTWVSDMVNDELETMTPVIREEIKSHPGMDEQEILWQLTLDMAKDRSRVMLPTFNELGPKKGRFSVQVLVYEYMKADKMLEMALQVHSLAPNMQVKIPSTKAGIKAMEEATFRGVSVMATLCCSVSQAVAVAEAIERGLERRTAAGLDNSGVNPVCACLLGVQETWLMGYCDKAGISIAPDAINWAGVAIAKKTYKIFKEKGYSTRVLVAYYRTLYHWREFIGGDVIMTIPAVWQKRFAKTSIEIRDYMSDTVPDEMLKELDKLEPFRMAYSEGVLSIDDFDGFAPVICTLRRFIQVYQRAVFQVRDIMLPDPTK